jgi:hypothetical protein
MSDIVKEIGRRQAYDILQSREPRATRGDLWGFRFFVWCEACATVVETLSSGRQDGVEGLYLALMLTGTGAGDGRRGGT